MDDLPPSVTLPRGNPQLKPFSGLPENGGGHPATAGLLLEWRLSPHGDWWAHVYWTAVIEGFRGGLDPRQSWLRADAVQRIAGEDYTTVPTTKAGPRRAHA